MISGSTIKRKFGTSCADPISFSGAPPTTAFATESTEYELKLMSPAINACDCVTDDGMTIVSRSSPSWSKNPFSVAMYACQYVGECPVTPIRIFAI